MVNFRHQFFGHVHQILVLLIWSCEYSYEKSFLFLTFFFLRWRPVSDPNGRRICSSFSFRSNLPNSRHSQIFQILWPASLLQSFGNFYFTATCSGDMDSGLVQCSNGWSLSDCGMDHLLINRQIKCPVHDSYVVLLYLSGLNMMEGI